MAQTILLEITHPQIAPGRIDGFRFIWAYYVNGYRPDRHCQACLTGRLARQFTTRTARSGGIVTFDGMDRFPYIYICGVAKAPRRELAGKNLHFPLEYRKGSVAEATTYNGYVLRALDASAVPIPRLPDGWHGIANPEHTRCRNFQFAVARFEAAPGRR